MAQLITTPTSSKVIAARIWFRRSVLSKGSKHQLFGKTKKNVSLKLIMPPRTNLFDLILDVYDEMSAIQYFQDEGLIHESRRCHGDHIMRLGQRSRHSGRNLLTPRWRCHVRTCRCEVTVKRDTFFEDSKIPLRKVTLDNLNWFGQSR